jgi:two-component system sensor histidine kinase KdpD
LRRPDVDWDEPTRAEFLAQIERETDRLSDLVNELMDRTGGKHCRARHPQRVPTLPLALVAGGLDRVRGLLDGRRIDVHVPAELPMIEVDASAIERVIANLVQNALKYAPADSQIRISGRVVDAVFELRVDDDGPGISPRYRNQIFNRFFRGPEARSSGRPGSGLGLAICLSIVNAHGGRIWADARRGGGTRVTVQLPLAADGPGLRLTERRRHVLPSAMRTCLVRHAPAGDRSTDMSPAAARSGRSAIGPD